MEKIYGMHKLVGLQLFWSRTPNFSSGTPTFCQMGVLNSCFQNSSESSDRDDYSISIFFMGRAVEIPCPTCPTWSHLIQDKLKISIYLSLDKYKCIKLIKFCISYLH